MTYRLFIVAGQTGKKRYGDEEMKLKTFLLLGLCICATACGQRPLKWKEDVMLPDGRVVVLKRYQEFKWPTEPFTPRGSSYHWIEFKHPETGEEIRWEDKGHLGTVALLLSHGAPYLLVKPVYGSSIRDYDCPNPPYLLLRYEAKSWKQVPLRELPVKRLRSNMSYGVDPDMLRDIKASDAHLSVQYTQNSHYNEQPWNMDFENAPEQTFGISNCTKERNYLLVR